MAGHVTAKAKGEVVAVALARGTRLECFEDDVGDPLTGKYVASNHRSMIRR